MVGIFYEWKIHAFAMILVKKCL